MRLNDFSRGIRVRDQRGGGLPGGRGGKVGCGGIIVVLIGALVFGIDPAVMLGGMEQMEQAGSPAASGSAEGIAGGTTLEESCTLNEYSRESCAALSSLDETWAPIFAQAQIPFERPTLNFYDGVGQSGCGTAQSAMGPFYCPADGGIYIDTGFYDTMAGQMGAPGDFARAYVMAHEYGHHVQTLTGAAAMVREAQGRDRPAANQWQVAMELQADCYAGVWASRNTDLIEPGDFAEGMQAASAIGDDTLMRNAGRRVSPESFTHGSSAQRMEWLRRGLETGDEDSCDTFAQLQR